MKNLLEITADMTVNEIAQTTGRSLRTVERTLQQCRKHFANYLHDHEPVAAPDACAVG